MPYPEDRPERIVARIAARQHGAVARRQLLTAGCTQDEIKGLVRRGSLHRKHHGVYAAGHASLSREGRWMAAVLACGEDAALSRVSAAQHWGITRRRSNRIEVSTPRYGKRMTGILRRFLRPLDGALAVEVRDGIPVTTVARTIVDLAEVMDEEELEFVLHEADFHHLLDIAAIEAIIAANPRFRGRGRLRRALASHRAGHTGARSRLELRVGRYLESVGVPASVAGFKVATPMGAVEVDRGWPRYRTYLEVDGGGHRRATTQRQDRERDQALELAGWRKFRIDGDHFDVDAAGATSALRAAFLEHSELMGLSDPLGRGLATRPAMPT